MEAGDGVCRDVVDAAGGVVGAGVVRRLRLGDGGDGNVEVVDGGVVRPGGARVEEGVVEGGDVGLGRRRRHRHGRPCKKEHVGGVGVGDAVVEGATQDDPAALELGHLLHM